jgi:hypothetical protein
LYIVIQKSHFLPWLKRWHTKPRTSAASESISETAIAARTDFPLNGEVNFGKVISAEFEGFELSVGS